MSDLSTDKSLNVKSFKKGQGWSFQTTQIKAFSHGYYNEPDQNPFESDDLRFEVYRIHYLKGLNF